MMDSFIAVKTAHYFIIIQLSIIIESSSSSSKSVPNIPLISSSCSTPMNSSKIFVPFPEWMSLWPCASWSFAPLTNSCCLIYLSLSLRITYLPQPIYEHEGVRNFFHFISLIEFAPRNVCLQVQRDSCWCSRECGSRISVEIMLFAERSFPP